MLLCCTQTEERRPTYSSLPFLVPLATPGLDTLPPLDPLPPFFAADAVLPVSSAE